MVGSLKIPTERSLQNIPSTPAQVCRLCQSWSILLSLVGEGAHLKVWKIDDQLVCQGQVDMAPAKYQSLAFPDIAQLAYVDTHCQFIAGCSSTGLLAIWDIR